MDGKTMIDADSIDAYHLTLARIETGSVKPARATKPHKQRNADL
jgi:hypothetical protein